MTCIKGEYVYTGGTTTTTTGGDGTCGGGIIPGMTCISGEYVYTGSSGGGSSLPVCTGGSTVPPVSGWLRIGLYDWIPPDHPSASLATCRSL
jgi:hypothetical protein